MEYSECRFGRVFVARLEDGEPIYDCILEVAGREGIESGMVLAVGGIRSGKVVTGPESPTGKVIPRTAEFDDARELVGFGTIIPIDGKPSLHMHAGIGCEEKTLVACPRITANVYLVLEVIIIELVGLQAAREYDAEFAVHILKLLSGTSVTCGGDMK